MHGPEARPWGSLCEFCLQGRSLMPPQLVLVASALAAQANVEVSQASEQACLVASTACAASQQLQRMAEEVPTLTRLELNQSESAVPHAALPGFRLYFGRWHLLQELLGFGQWNPLRKPKRASLLPKATRPAATPTSIRSSSASALSRDFVKKLGLSFGHGLFCRYVVYKTSELSPDSLNGDLTKTVWEEVAWTKVTWGTHACFCVSVRQRVSLRVIHVSLHPGLRRHIHAHQATPLHPGEDALG